MFSLPAVLHVPADRYCNYNNLGLQWFSSSLWLAGAIFCIPAGMSKIELWGDHQFLLDSTVDGAH
jgi:hypothetical protein